MIRRLIILITMCCFSLLGMETVEGDQQSSSRKQKLNELHKQFKALIHNNDSIMIVPHRDNQKPSLVLLPPQVTQQVMEYTFESPNNESIEDNLQALNDILRNAEICFCVTSRKLLHIKYKNGFPKNTQDYLLKMRVLYEPSIQGQFDLLDLRIKTILENNIFDEKNIHQLTKVKPQLPLKVDSIANLQ